MTKKEFERIEEAENIKAMFDSIYSESDFIYNDIYDFCKDNDLEVDVVIDIIIERLQNTKKNQMKKDGYISKI